MCVQLAHVYANTMSCYAMPCLACRVWEGLLLAAFFNMQSNLYYELFSNYMGKGDKESFGHALRAARLHYHLLPTSVGSLGITRFVLTWPPLTNQGAVPDCMPSLVLNKLRAC